MSFMIIPYPVWRHVDQAATEGGIKYHPHVLEVVRAAPWSVRNAAIAAAAEFRAAGLCGDGATAH